MTQEQMIEKLQNDVEFHKGQFEDLYGEFCFYRERVTELTSEHAALEKAYQVLEEERDALQAQCEELRATLARERRAHAQGNSLAFLQWKEIEVKKREMPHFDEEPKAEETPVEETPAEETPAE